jgi:hypothetical protein
MNGRHWWKWAIAKGFYIPARVKVPSRRKWWKRKHARSHEIINAFSRFREGPLPGHELGVKLIGSHAILGTFKKFVADIEQKNLRVDYSAGSSTGVSTHWRRCLDQVNPGPPFRSGGPFRYVEYHVPSGDVSPRGHFSSLGRPGQPAGTYWTYDGGFVPDSSWGSSSPSSFLSAPLPDVTSLVSYYTKAWDCLKPRVPKAGLAQFTYELRDLPGMLRTTSEGLHNLWNSFGGGKSSILMSPSSVADHFLNHNFGWVPFISDLQKLKDVWDRSNELIARAILDNHTWMKRFCVLDEVETSRLITRQFNSGTDPSDLMEMMSPLMAPMVVSGTTCTAYNDVTEYTSKRVWSKGEFMYYRPEFDDHLSDFSSQWMNVQRLLTIYGARINPTVLWKITPWSWLVDWFTGIGKFVERLDDFVTDGIVARSLYLMEQVELRHVKTCTLNFYSGPLHLDFVRYLRTKQRAVGDSPYGFSLPWSGLTPTQWAILGSIGISRTSKGFISRGT